MKDIKPHKLLLVNASINSTSTGRIAEEIGREAKIQGFDVSVAYGFVNNSSNHHTIKVGNPADHYLHALLTRLTDRHGFGSKAATKRLVAQLETNMPDVVNLHNIHGYYLNIPVLFECFNSMDRPVVWTFHDCWPFTGHCSYFDAVNCDRWKTQCHDCPNTKGYPTTLFADRSTKNYTDKQKLFRALQNLTLVAPCQWMANNLRQSFLGDRAIRVIYNGVNTDVFSPADDEEIVKLRKSYGLIGKHVILGVASIWDKRKGLDDFKKMALHLSDDERIVLIGLSDKQIGTLPDNILGIKRTENVKQLVGFYSMANVFANPTYVDNFPTTNIESLACGTPVITYDTGGSPEAVDRTSGSVVEKGDYSSMLKEIRKYYGIDNNELRLYCRKRVVDNFNCHDRFADYIKLFKKLCITTQ